MSRCSILRRVTVIGNVTVSAKSKFLVVALKNVALLHSPKVLWNWITLQFLLKQNFSSLPSRMSRCSILRRFIGNWVTLQFLLNQNFSSLPSRMSRCSIEEISKRILPLGYAFADFSRKRKVSASVGGTSPHQQSIPFDERLG